MKKNYKFIKKVIAKVEKSEKDILIEKTEEFIEVAQIEIEMYISKIKNGEIRMEEATMKKAEKEKKKAKKKLEKLRYTMPADEYVETYIDNLQKAEREVERREDVVRNHKDNIERLKKEAAKFEEYLSYIIEEV